MEEEAQAANERLDLFTDDCFVTAARCQGGIDSSMDREEGW